MVIKSSPTLGILPAPRGQGTMKFPCLPLSVRVGCCGHTEPPDETLALP